MRKNKTSYIKEPTWFLKKGEVIWLWPPNYFFSFGYWLASQVSLSPLLLHGIPSADTLGWRYFKVEVKNPRFSYHHTILSGKRTINCLDIMKTIFLVWTENKSRRSYIKNWAIDVFLFGFSLNIICDYVVIYHFKNGSDNTLSKL